MKNRLLRSGLIALAGAAVGVFLLLLSNGALFPAHAPADVPDEESQVTCYKWVENGTARVLCPDLVYSPDAVVNITVKPCSEYEYKIDEERPCSRHVESGTLNMSG